MRKRSPARYVLVSFLLFLATIFYTEYRLVDSKEVTTIKSSDIKRAAESIKLVKTSNALLSTSTKEQEVVEQKLEENGPHELSDSDLKRIEERFEKRRELLSKSCVKQGHQQVESYNEMATTQRTFLLNQIFHDSDLQLSGCLPPKTGSTSWNHFWWGTSKFDGAKAGQFDSFQSQGNRHVRTWIKTLNKEQPEVLFLTTRHPIQRLISGWNNILCDKNCRNQGRVVYARKAKEAMRGIYTRMQNHMKGKFNDQTDGIHMLSFPALVNMLINDFDTLDKQSKFDIHFHSYARSCFVCEVPYKYIVRLETFSEDYQYITRKLGLWDKFDDKHKMVGSSKENESVGLNYTSVLSMLPREQLTQLIRLKQDEMDMFGYTFDEETMECKFVDGS